MEKRHVPDESSTFGLNRDKLAKLWGLGTDLPQGASAPDCDRDKAELLRGQLAESLPLDAGLAHMLPNILTMVCDKLRPFTGCSFGALLTDPETDLLVIETIKDLHKRQAEAAKSGPIQEVATAIYYAAIASALVHHDVRITKLSYESLSKSFEGLAGSDWLPADLRQLLTEAHKCCIRHMRRSEK
jgi:hypothetical protein